MSECGCFYGRDCTKTTVCANENVVEELMEKQEELRIELKEEREDRHKDWEEAQIRIRDLEHRRDDAASWKRAYETQLEINRELNAHIEELRAQL